MFLPRETPPELGPEHLLGLRMSLNTPVVSTEEVPTGPARAALAVHRDPAGAATITLAVRPVQASHAVFYGLEDDLRDETRLAMGVDAALSFGESLGFLFDDDELASGEKAQAGAFALWSSIVGDDELSKVMGITTERSHVSREDSDVLETDLGEELLLEELALEEDPLEELPGLEDLAARRPLPVETVPAPSLTKFRALAPAPPAPEPEPEIEPERPRRALLARVRLVKRAAKQGKSLPEESDAGASRSLRLLTSF
jgi:hypothetical protein